VIMGRSKKSLRRVRKDLAALEEKARHGQQIRLVQGRHGQAIKRGKQVEQTTDSRLKKVAGRTC
jgi:hypothetical protein